MKLLMMIKEIKFDYYLDNIIFDQVDIKVMETVKIFLEKVYVLNVSTDHRFIEEAAR